MLRFGLMFFLTTLFFGGNSFAQKLEGSEFYDIEVESIEGNKYRLSEYQDKVVLIAAILHSINLSNLFMISIRKKGWWYWEFPAISLAGKSPGRKMK